MSRNYLSKNDELRAGDYLLSNDGNYKAIFQEDGNFVIYNWRPVWASDTWGTNAFRLIMQADSNLVMYNKCNDPKWATDTYIQGQCVCHLEMTNEGNLVLWRGADEVWSSANSKGKKL